MSEMTREQAQAFLASLWPCGHMSHLDNPTRTYFSALLGVVPQGTVYSRKSNSSGAERVAALADVLRQIAHHIETPDDEATAALQHTGEA